MTISDEDRAAIVAQRLRTASEMLSDAKVLLDRGSLRSAANRSYYCAFHAISALAIGLEQTIKTHRGVIGFFHAEFIAKGVFGKRFGLAVQEAFEDRSEADYEDIPHLDPEQIRARLSDLGELVEAVRKHLGASKGLCESGSGSSEPPDAR